MAVNNLVKRLQNIMRQDAGVNGDAQRIEQMVWIFFLKVYDAQEDVWYLDDPDHFKSIIPEPLRWRNWAPSKDEEGKTIASITGDELLNFINNVLFPVLKGEDAQTKDGTIAGIRVNNKTARGQAIVQEVFKEVNNYMKNGVLLRQMIDVVDEIDFTDPDDSHTFNDIYETILKDLQGAGHAGEFYTPRALTDFIIYELKPKLGEVVGDWASGTDGFLVSALNYLEKQCKTAEDWEKYQNSVEGQEWKPFPYLLGVTNLLLHNIKNPKQYHMDSLGVNMSEYNHHGKVDVEAMNPPYGGATDATTKQNFPTEFRSSETADLFMYLIMQRLKVNGRASVIVPDGFLFGIDGPKLALKQKLLREFNLHTIIRLPGSIFAPYTSIATNILFFNNERAEDAPEETATKDVWFYRMDIPEGYKHFSKSKPMLFEHTKKIREWWNDRHEIINGDGDVKSKKFSAQELLDMDCNFDQCKFPKEEDEVLRPEELLKNYHDQCKNLMNNVENTLSNIENEIGLCSYNTNNVILKISTPHSLTKLSNLFASLSNKLEASILQEAIEGRLVEQNPDDEPAAKLLDRIAEEKAKLVKEKKIKADKNASRIYRTDDGHWMEYFADKHRTDVCIDDEIPFDIPDTWEWCRVGSIVEIGSARRVHQKDWRTKGIPFYRAREIGKLADYGTVENELFIDKSLYKEFSKSGVPLPGDLMVTAVGTLGKVYIVKDGETFYYKDGSVLCLSNIYKLDSNFLKLALISPYFIKQYKQESQGTTVATLTMVRLQRYLIPIPPIKEQRAIVEKLGELLPKLNSLK